jgi:hypothetical protein
MILLLFCRTNPLCSKVSSNGWSLGARSLSATTAWILGNHQRNLQRTSSREVMTYMMWRLMDRCFVLAFLYGYTRHSYSDQNAALTLACSSYYPDAKECWFSWCHCWGSNWSGFFVTSFSTKMFGWTQDSTILIRALCCISVPWCFREGIS